MFKVDTHVHTGETSGCGKVPARSIVALYREFGHDAIVICDHYAEGFFEDRCTGAWAERMDRYLAGYRAAVEAGETDGGPRVFLGIELKLRERLNDFLIFGLTEALLYDRPRLYELTLAETRAFCDEIGALLAVAHPFRPNMPPVPPGLIHGVEVVNGHPNHANDNPRALAFAQAHGLLMVGGSDAHFTEGAGTAWMNFSRPLADSADLARAVREGDAVEIVGPADTRLALGRGRIARGRSEPAAAC